MSQSTDTILFKEPWECHDHNSLYSVALGVPHGDFKDLKEKAFQIKHWETNHMKINDASTAVIEDSKIDNLTVNGFCFIKNSTVHHLFVGMFGNLFICEDNEIYTLSIAGTVHSVSSASKVQHIELHRGGRIRLLTKDYQLGRPIQPDNIRLDEDRDWCCGLLMIESKAHIAEYWAFG